MYILIGRRMLGESDTWIEQGRVIELEMGNHVTPKILTDCLALIKHVYSRLYVEALHFSYFSLNYWPMASWEKEREREKAGIHISRAKPVTSQAVNLCKPESQARWVLFGFGPSLFGGKSLSASSQQQQVYEMLCLSVCLSVWWRRRQRWLKGGSKHADRCGGHVCYVL